jgi:hypothetical protein
MMELCVPWCDVPQTFVDQNTDFLCLYYTIHLDKYNTSCTLQYFRGKLMLLMRTLNLLKMDLKDVRLYYYNYLTDTCHKETRQTFRILTNNQLYSQALRCTIKRWIQSVVHKLYYNVYWNLPYADNAICASNSILIISALELYNTYPLYSPKRNAC